MPYYHTVESLVVCCHTHSGLNVCGYSVHQFAENQFKDNPITSETTNLTTLEVMENTEHTALPIVLPLSDPYPDKTPTQMLTRQYLLNTYVFDTSIRQHFFPDRILRDIPTNAQYLSRFSYFRASVKLRFVIVSTPMLYGALAVSFVPYTKSTTAFSSLHQRSQASMHLLDINQQESMELVLPYVSPKLYWEKGGDDPSWRVDIAPLFLNALTNNTTLSFTVQVFGSFENIEASGFRPQAVFQSSNRVLDRSSRLGSLAGAATGTISAIANMGTSWMSSMVNNPSLPIATSSAVGGTLGAGAFEAAKILAKAMPSQNKPKPIEPCRLDVAPDLNSASGSLSLPMLGDIGPKDHSFLPGLNNISSVRDICMVPTLHSVQILDYLDPFVLPCHPFCENAYSNYFAPMFKYWRGSTRVLIKFMSAKDVSARVKITLFPTTDPAPPGGANPYVEGDLPTWVLTVKGSTEWCLEVPYLQTTPWLFTGEYGKYSLAIQLLDPLPQPFDRPVLMPIAVFMSAGSDFQFAGLQSCVPRAIDSDKAQLQCSVASSMMNPQTIGHTHDFPYQGGYTDIYSILTRYSSRDPSPELLFPFPILISSLSEQYKLDNFDYISNLFCFYTGDTNVRFLFASGASDGLLRSSVSNSNTDVSGRQWKAGNSMALTDQTVWPMLEYRYPYLNKMEFDSIRYPNGMFAQEIDHTASLSQMFISAADNFRLLYLLPVPDYFISSEEKASFQCYTSKTAILEAVPRQSICKTYAGSCGTASTHLITLDSAFDFKKSAYIELTVDVLVPAASGAAEGRVAIQVGSDPSIAVPTDPSNFTMNCLVGGWITFDSKNIQSRTFSGAIVPFELVGPLYLSLSKSPTSPLVYFSWTVRVSPWKDSTVLSSIQHVSDTMGMADCLVSPASGETVFSTDVVNAFPIDVSMAGPVSVVGTDDPGKPVWTSQYRPL